MGWSATAEHTGQAIMMLIRLRPDEHAELTSLVQKTLVTVDNLGQWGQLLSILRALRAATDPPVPVYEYVDGEHEELF